VEFVVYRVVVLQLHVADVQLHSNDTSSLWSWPACVCHGSQAQCFVYSWDAYTF